MLDKRLKEMWPAILAGLLAVGALAALGGCGEPNNAQVSPEYSKLPPGEGERRLKETLARRSGKQPPATPPAQGK